MPVIVVANPKGGVGKSTLATNVAGWYARSGHAVMLGDIDRQQSSREWLTLRPKELPTIRSWEIDDDHRLKPPRGTTHLVIDTPAGLHGRRLDAVLKVAERLLVPLQPSPFDIRSTHTFLRAVREHPRAANLAIGFVAMRVKEHTHAAEHLQEFFATLGALPLASLRDTQNYVHLAARGLTLWDVTASRVERDLAQWQPLVQWLEA